MSIPSNTKRFITSLGGVLIVATAAMGQASFQGLGDLPGNLFDSSAWGVSADGMVVVGQADPTIGREAFRWTSGGGMLGLGDLPGGSFFSNAYAVSGDGSVVVGISLSASGYSTGEAFRWTSGGGMVGLGDLPGGGFFSEATATSADGAVVVGWSSSASAAEAFLWTAADGMQSLHDLLVNDFGLDLTGWQLREAFGISADGMTIVGEGTNPDGFPEAWIATIPAETPVPADRDFDGDVDGVDFSKFASCFNKAGNPPWTFGCDPDDQAALDFDDDNDVDGVDFAKFASCFNKAGNPPRTFGCPQN